MNPSSTEPSSSLPTTDAVQGAGGERIKALEEALRPFATFGETDEGENIVLQLMGDRIVDWFGPSDFGAARRALLSPTPSRDEELRSTSEPTTPAPKSAHEGESA